MFAMIAKWSFSSLKVETSPWTYSAVNGGDLTLIVGRDQSMPVVPKLTANSTDRFLRSRMIRFGPLSVGLYCVSRMSIAVDHSLSSNEEMFITYYPVGRSRIEWRREGKQYPHF